MKKNNSNNFYPIEQTLTAEEAADRVAKRAMELAKTNVDVAMTFVQNTTPPFKFIKHHREFVEIKSFVFFNHLICIIIEFLVIYLHSIISMHENKKKSIDLLLTISKNIHGLIHFLTVHQHYVCDNYLRDILFLYMLLYSHLIKFR
jgi:hypothetical protein